MLYIFFNVTHNMVTNNSTGTQKIVHGSLKALRILVTVGVHTLLFEKNTIESEELQMQKNVSTHYKLSA